MEVFEVYVWLWVAIISGISGINAYESGIYVDNVFTRKTEMVNRLQWGSKRAIKQEILSLLGLQHLPKHVVGGKHNSAPSYMLDLYRTLQNDVMMEVEDEDQWMYRIKQEILNKNLTLPGMEDNAEEADMIMSFVNNGEFCYVIFFQGVGSGFSVEEDRCQPCADRKIILFLFTIHLS